MPRIYVTIFYEETVTMTKFDKNSSSVRRALVTLAKSKQNCSHNV